MDYGICTLSAKVSISNASIQTLEGKWPEGRIIPSSKPKPTANENNCLRLTNINFPYYYLA